MGINKFTEEMNVILSATKEKVKADKNAKTKQGVAMVEAMVSVICRYVEKEAESNSSFEEALGYEWKSAEKMLKFVWAHAKDMAVNIAGVSGMGCMVSDDVVYDWINEYYAKDDKAEVEAELKAEAEKKAKAEAEKKLDAELEAQAREKAVAKLSKDDDFNTKSDEEKEKLIKAETSKIKTRLKSAAKKKAEKDSTAKAKTDADANVTKVDAAADKAETTGTECSKSEASATLTPTGKNGQFTLFDLFM